MALRSRNNGGSALASALEAEGVDTVFGTVGHGNLAFVDALVDSQRVQYVPVLHEQVAAHAADAFFRVSGRLAVVTTTVGPGFTNLATGLGDALLDSSAMVVVAGGIPLGYAGREPLQELALHADDEQRGLFRALAKRVVEVRRAEDIGHRFHEAAKRALNGCPGPTILHVPMDLFSATVDAPEIRFSPAEQYRVSPDPAAIQRALDVIGASERPILYAGGGVIVSGAGAALTRLAEQTGIPVSTTMSGQGAIPEDHDLAVGFTGVVGSRPANEAMRRADVVVAIGTRFPEMDSSSWRGDVFIRPNVRLVHIDVDPGQIDKIYPTTVPVVSDALRAIESLSSGILGRTDCAPARWDDWRDQIRDEKSSWDQELASLRSDDSFPYEPARLLTQLRQEIPPDAILVTGVGIRHAVGQHFPILRERTQVVASGFGTMGQEMAAPLGSALARPDTPVVAVVGDGAFMACLAAIPSALLAGIHAVWIVCNNGGYGSIAIYQSKHFGREVGTKFSEPAASASFDYAGIARSFGANGVRVDHPDTLNEALKRALTEPGVWVLEVPVTAMPRVLASGHWDVNDILAGKMKGNT